MKFLRMIGLILIALVGMCTSAFAQNWQPLVNKSSVALDAPLLMTDGTVMCPLSPGNST